MLRLCVCGGNVTAKQSENVCVNVFENDRQEQESAFSNMNIFNWETKLGI